jgi:HPt (histidine-containing phosphotransfer) domain-containing protein
MGKSADDGKPAAAANYRPLLSEAGRKQAMAKLKSGDMLARASRVIAMRTAELRGAVLALVDQLEEAMRNKDWPTVFSATHEIRGFAETAGLNATGRIANGLCHYLDSIEQLGAGPDAAIVNLHVDAVLRSARTEDDAARHGSAVAEQLAALVARKLADVKEAARR